MKSVYKLGVIFIFSVFLASMAVHKYYVSITEIEYVKEKKRFKL